MKNHWWKTLLVFPLVLAACGGGGSPSPGSISGTVDSSLVRPTSLGWVPGEVVVKFRSDLSLQSLRPLSAEGHTLSLVRSLALPRVELFKAPQADPAQTLQIARALNSRSDIEWAEPNYRKTYAAQPNDNLYKAQWHYPAMNLEAAWDISTGTDGTVVGVVDSGILFDGNSSPNTHPDFVGKVLPGYDFVSDPAAALDGDARDPNPYEPLEAGQSSSDHGSHVAGTIAANTNNTAGVAGVNWKAKVVMARALGKGGGSNVDIAEASLWAAGIAVAGVPNNSNPAQLLNLSIQGEAPCSNLEQETFNQIAAAGVIVVVAAGNSNFDASRSSPGNCNNVITVGATDINGNRASYSNYGSRIDLMAPGGDNEQSFRVGDSDYSAGVLSIGRDYASGGSNFRFMPGTSMAAPHVAGLVSIMKGLKPSLSTSEARSILQNTARPLSNAQCGQTNGCGAGLVDAAKALAALQAAPTPPAPPAPPQTKQAKRYALALYQTAGGFDISKSNGIIINPTSTLTPYQIGSLEAGTYTVVALTDLNDNQNFDDGEPAGIVANVLVQSGKDTSNIIIKLQNLQLQSLTLAPAWPSNLQQAINRVLQRR